MISEIKKRPTCRNPVVYTESHDEVANGRARVVEEVAPGNVDDDFFAHNKAMIAAALVLTTCGIPMLFQGQEFKQHGWFSDDHDIDWERRKQFNDIVAAFTALIAQLAALSAHLSLWRIRESSIPPPEAHGVASP